MAKGSVRKKGKKWYGRFYIEDESGRKVQKEFCRHREQGGNRSHAPQSDSGL
ncbi:hypothetical protein EfsSVR2281_01880 [Enterococcus faecalis]|nr:hypothetical protein EfsSVR2281_01880 [Enterococcus faecalis]